MINRPQVLDHMGLYINHPPVKELSKISERVFDLFHTIMGGHEKQQQSDRDYLVTRLIYISEITSTAIRLNASWALTHAAMSLARDRYEQVVRFSWLARQKDDAEMQKFYAYYHARANKIFRSLKDKAKEEFDKMVDNPPEWTTRPFTSDEKKYFEAWDTLDLLSLVKKRDKIEPLGQSLLAIQKLEQYYPAVYQQFSSVSHTDMYSVALLGLHKNALGDFVLAPDPYWPAFLTCFNALFDTLQCFECAQGFYNKDCEKDFAEIFQEWDNLANKLHG